jgi:selenocysteine lyase/cysteine desulfurase
MAGTIAAVDYFAWVGESMAQAYQGAFGQHDGRRRYVRSALAYLFDYEEQLAKHLIGGLQQLPGVRIQGITALDALDRRVPTVAITVDGADPASIARQLGQRNIFVWSGHNYAVETARHLGIYDQGGAVRIGPVHYNSIAELDQLLNALDDILPSTNAA